MTRGLRSEVIKCVGGLNLEDSYLEVKPGQVIAAKNYEQLQTGGYRRSDGYSKVETTVVPGSGDIAAVAQYDDVTYCWRYDTSKYKLYRSTGAGWTEVNLGWIITFNNGAVEPAEGDTLVGGIGITGVVSRITLVSGGWGAGTAAGFISLRSVAGDWTAVAGATNLTNVGATITYCKAAAAGVQVSVTGEPRSGIFHNFYGSANDGAYYWCDGTKYIIELRPATNYVAVAEIVCDHLVEHNEHLFFGSAVSGSARCSVPGSPFLIDGAAGSIEKATGTGIVGMASYKGALAIFGDSQTSIIYGQDSNDFLLKRLDGVGGLAGVSDGTSAGVEGKLLFLSQSGLLFDFVTTQEFGDFNSSAATYQIQRAMIAKRANVTAIGRRVDKGQVRVFYSDGSAYFFTFFGAQMVGVLPQKFPIAVKCYATNADSSMDTQEVSVFGSTDGYVYKTDDTGQLDGVAMESFLVYPFWHMQAPTTKKRWRGLFIEGSADGNGLLLRVKQSYDQTGANSGVAIDQDFSGGNAGIWGSAIWGSFVWGGSYGADVGYELVGTSKNMSVTVFNDGTDTDDGAHEINSMIVNYTTRGAVRE